MHDYWAEYETLFGLLFGPNRIFGTALVLTASTVQYSTVT